MRAEVLTLDRALAVLALALVLVRSLQAMALITIWSSGDLLISASSVRTAVGGDHDLISAPWRSPLKSGLAW